MSVGDVAVAVLGRPLTLVLAVTIALLLIVPAVDRQVLAFAQRWRAWRIGRRGPAAEPRHRYTVVVEPWDEESGWRWAAGIRMDGGKVGDGSGWRPFLTKRGALRWARRWVRRHDRLARRRGFEQQVHP